MDERSTTFIDTIFILLKYRKTIILHVFIIFFLSVCITLIVPLWYRAYTTIIVPIDEGISLGFSSLLNQLPLSGMNLGVMPEETSRVIAILDSRTIMESVVNEFDLIKQYRVKNMEKAVKVLRHHINAKVNDDGSITLRTEAGTRFFSTRSKRNEARECAKDMANYFVSELDRMNNELKVDWAKNTRIFIERRYQQNISDLNEAEVAFKNYQEKYGTIAMPEQTKATITAAAELKAQIIAKEIEIDVLQKSVGSSHTELLKAKSELIGLSEKYNEFTLGIEKTINNKSEKRENQKNVFLPMVEVPELGLQYARLFRDVYLQEKIMEILLPIYEQAKIKEVKDTSTIQVLDEAVLPIRKARPKRAIICILASFMAFLFSATVFICKEKYVELKTSDPKTYNKIYSIFSLFKKSK
jgi:uncharacterized protein involved in exopolysaccharide biosynthesis